jgi:hypothetical protein
VGDAASCFDYARLADLGMAVSQSLLRPALLHQKLHSFFTTPSPLVQNEANKASFENTGRSAVNTATSLTPPRSKQSHAGLRISSPTSKPKGPVTTSVHSSHSTSNLDTQSGHSQMIALSSLSRRTVVRLNWGEQALQNQVNASYMDEFQAKEKRKLASPD